MMLAVNQPRDCFCVSLIMFTLSAINLSVVTFWPKLLRRFRVSWGRFGGGVPVSRLGGAAWRLAFAIFGLAAMLAGFGAISNSQVPIFLLAGFIVVVVAGFYDTYRRNRKNK
jgi:hypothetical protein